jgi:hypothetical protein
VAVARIALRRRPAAAERIRVTDSLSTFVITWDVLTRYRCQFR